jgi:hypothetical protein
MSAKPMPTSRSCVAKSMSARKMLIPADSWIPTMFRRTRPTMTAAPTTMSQGLSLRDGQKIER